MTNFITYIDYSHLNGKMTFWESNRLFQELKKLNDGPVCKKDGLKNKLDVIHTIRILRPLEYGGDFPIKVDLIDQGHMRSDPDKHKIEVGRQRYAIGAIEGLATFLPTPSNED